MRLDFRDVDRKEYERKMANIDKTIAKLNTTKRRYQSKILSLEDESNAKAKGNRKH